MPLILKKPVITEKSISDTARGVYTFEVTKTANKNQIKTAVESAFSVTVKEVNTLVRSGSTKRTGRKRLLTPGKPVKLARVLLKQGDKIDLFEIKEK